MTVTNKEIAETLRVAKKHLSHGYDSKRDYICHAIVQAVEMREVGYLAAEKAKNLITQRLAGFFTVYDFLTKAHKISADYMQRQAYRHAWLDALILELETGKVTTHYEVPNG